MAREHNPDIILWVDLEMTGLNPQVHRIVEIAAIITDWKFNEIAAYDSIVYQPKKVMKDIDPWCVKQHTSSGLLPKIPSGKKLNKVESELISVITKHTKSKLPIILAGSSIHFDRRFIIREMPHLDKLLHYRMLDVTAWKVVMSTVFHVKHNKSEAHRALEDIRGSIDELKSYVSKVKTDSRG